MDKSNVQLKEALGKIRSLINKSVLDKNIKDSVLVPIPIIEEKINTQQIHVGLIGESSQDKVAVLNSLLNTDFFRLNSGGNSNSDVSGSGNKPRLVRTLIEHAPEQTLSVTMFNGKAYNTRNNMLRLTRRFLPQRYEGFSLVDKFKYFFGIHKDTATNAEIVSELYHNMVSSEDAHQQVSSLRLGLPLESLPEYLVIVDTPSLEINDSMSQKIIKETVKILCDEIIVLTPAENPFSQKLTSLLQDNILTNQDACRIFLTGIEGIKDQGRREELVANVAYKAESENQISARNVIGAPAALERAMRGVASHITPQEVNSIPQEERDYLIEQYKRNLERCFTAYNIRKETAVVEKKFAVVEEYIRFIIQLLKDSTKKNNEQIEQLQRLMVPPIQDFLRNFYANIDVRSKTKTLSQNVLDECKGYMKEFVDSTFSLVDKLAQGKNPKDAVQGIMGHQSVQEEGSKTCAKCYQSYIYKFDYLKGVYRDVYVRLESDLRKMYGITDTNIKAGEHLQPMKAVPYNLNISKSGLTTFRLKRIFTSLSTIQAQVKNAIQDSANKFFGQISGTYSTNLTQVNRALDQQSNQIRADLTKRYKKMVDQRIADLNARAKVLQDNNSSLTSLEGIVNKVIGYDVQ